MARIKMDLREIYKDSNSLADFVLTAKAQGYADSELIEFIADFRPSYNTGFQNFRPGDMKG